MVDYHLMRFKGQIRTNSVTFKTEHQWIRHLIRKRCTSVAALRHPRSDGLGQIFQQQRVNEPVTGFVSQNRKTERPNGAHARSCRHA